MPTPTTYTYSLSLDAPGGVMNSDKLAAAVRGSSISVALASIESDGTNFSFSFKDVLSDADRATLDGGNGAGGTNGQPSDIHPAGGLIASTDNTPNAPTLTPVTITNVPTMMVTPIIGGMLTRVDGNVVTAAASQTAKCDIVIPEPSMHVEGVEIQWLNCFAGDHGIIAIVNPAGSTTLATPTNQGDTTVTLPPQVAPYYDPANGADSIEFWSSDGATLLEVVLISSRSGTTLTLKSALNNAHASGEKVRVRVGRFVPVRGPNGIDGGFRVLGTGRELIQHQQNVTEQLPAGFVLSLVLVTTSDVGNRSLAINFVLREP